MAGRRWIPRPNEVQRQGRADHGWRAWDRRRHGATPCRRGRQSRGVRPRRSAGSRGGRPDRGPCDNLLFKMTDEDWDVVIDTHLKGTFLCARAVQKVMVDRKYGKMVFLSSTSALGNRGQANYSAAKAGLQGMARTLAIELGPFNINVNAVAPGFVETRMTRATAERMGMDFETFKLGAASQIPLRRIGQPEDIASVIAFLCSDESSFVSGQTIYVRGGP